MAERKTVANINPITKLDYPDPDVIRVEAVYYMVSTTMHFMPGCEILRSYDLVSWEHAAYVYDVLDGTDAQKLDGELNIYGKGMWAATIRYHKGMFYVCFVANDTGKTYLYSSAQIEGPWKKSVIEGFYHDCSLLFDDDDRVYIAYGNKYIHILELKSDLSGPKENGLHRIAVSDEGHPGLGYEGTHLYKINGKYYMFFIHSLRSEWKRVEACFVADSLEGEFVGGDILNDDMGYCNQGVAQGGIVDTPDGKWYAVLFQDRGAVGRVSVLVPMHWEGDYPVFGMDGKVPEQFEVPDSRPGYEYRPLVQSDNFKGDSTGDSFGFKSCWQFNHEPDLSLVHRDAVAGRVVITTDKLCKNVTQAKNTLTQRMLFPDCCGEVTVDGLGLKEGDYAGLCALQGCYGLVALTKKNGHMYVVMINQSAENGSLEGTVQEEVLIQGETVKFRVEADFLNMKDEAKFYYDSGDGWKPVGVTQKLFFKLDHFTGCRFGLFVYSTKEVGGSAAFSEFKYEST